MVAIKRCKHNVVDKRTGRKRICKLNANNNDIHCYIHKISKNNSNNNNDNNDIVNDIIEEGKCCFCKNDCNPLSQSCGRCARSLSWYGFLPNYGLDSFLTLYIQILSENDK